MSENYQRLVLNQILLQKDEEILNKLVVSDFIGYYKKIFSIIYSHYIEHNNIISGKDLLNVASTRCTEDEVKRLKSYLVSISKSSTELSTDVLLKGLQDEVAILKTEQMLPELINSFENKDKESAVKLLAEIRDSLTTSSEIYSKSISDVKFTKEELATTPIFLENTALQTNLSLSGLTIIGAGSGQGKSIFTLQQLSYAYDLGEKVSLFTLELSESQTIARLFCLRDGYDYGEFLKLPYEKQKDLISKFQQTFDNDRFYIRYFRYDVEKLKQAILHDIKKGAKVIAIDYLNLVEKSGRNDEWRELANFVKELHQIAITHGVLIISPTQIELEETKDGSVRATTRGSKELEYSSSVFLFLHQNKEEYKESLIKLVVQKARNAQKFTGILGTEFNKMRFKDLGIILED